MKKILSITISSLCITSFAGLAHAEEYYSSAPADDGGYNTSTTPSDGGYSSSSTSQSSQQSGSHKHGRNKLSVYVNIPSSTPGYVVNESTTYVTSDHHHRHHNSNIQWLPMTSDDAIPEDAVLGGTEAGNDSDLFICRGNYNGGIHPGKVVAGNCDISWGGREIVLNDYEVLVSPYSLRWVTSTRGFLPRGAIHGGQEHGRTLYICQAQYNNGIHPGKVVGSNCNIAWGGKEVSVPFYNVLVR